MANFNIDNSHVEQVNDGGDNVKITGNTGPVAYTQRDGQTVQTAGNENKVRVEPKQSFWAKLWTKIKGWFTGGTA